jgi:hypothetical protein
MIVGSRLSSFGRPAAMPSSIHARLKLSPSKCASLGSLGSGETTGFNHAPFCAEEICGMKVCSQLEKMENLQEVVSTEECKEA